jgi:DNA-binding protein H-NS
MAAASRNKSNALPKIDHLDVASLNKLIEQAQKLLASRREETTSKLIEEMRSKAKALGLDLDEVLGRKASNGRKQRSDLGVKLKPKFKGPNGETYTGRGPTPKWLKSLERKGQSREKFRIAK